MNTQKERKGNFNSHKTTISLIAGFFLLFFSVALPVTVFAAWQNPTANPPGNNSAEPVNAADTPQNKQGTLWLSSGNAYLSNTNTYGFIVQKGRVGIGSTTPWNLLSVDSIPGTAVANMGGGRIVGLSEVPVNATEAVSRYYVDSLVGGGIPSPGANGNTLRSNGTNWLANSFLYNNGTAIGIGTNSPGDRLDVYNGYYSLRFGGDTASWAGSNRYPTIYSSAGSKWVMIINPHIPYTQSGFNGFLGSMTGATIRMGSDPATTHEWDLGPGTSLVGVDKFSIGRDGTSFLAIDNAGRIGIGTTNPGARLSISGGEGTYSAPDFGSTNLGSINILSTVSGRRNAITFSSAGSSNAQAGIYVHQDNSLGTHMYLATTDSYATGPQARLTIRNNGNVGIGTTDPGTYRLYVNGHAYVRGSIEASGADLAEEFATDRKYPAGTVLVMGSDDYFKSAKSCSQEYDKAVIGVVSDMASIIIGKIDAPTKAIVSMTGVVPVKVNSSNGLIKKGDLLVTSSISGEAMKGINPPTGTIIGKALENANGAKDEVMTLINLQ